MATFTQQQTGTTFKLPDEGQVFFALGHSKEPAGNVNIWKRTGNQLIGISALTAQQAGINLSQIQEIPTTITDMQRGGGLSFSNVTDPNLFRLGGQITPSPDVNIAPDIGPGSPTATGIPFGIQGQAPSSLQQFDELIAKGDILGQQASKITGIPYKPVGITADALKSTPTPTFQQTPTTSGFDATKLDTTFKIEDIFKLAPAEQNYQTKLDELAKKIEEGTQRPAFQAEQERVQDLPALQKLTRDYSSQLKLIQLEASNIQQRTQAPGSGVTTEIDRRQQAEALRLNSVKALGVYALLQMAQGNQTTAQDAADRATALKFDPIEAQIKAMTANAQLAKDSPELSLAEKKRAQQVIDANAKKTELVNAAKKEEEQIWAATFEAMKNGLTDSTIISQAQNSGSIAKAAQILAPYLQKKETVPSDIQTFKSFFPNVDLTTPQGQKTYLDWQAKEAAAGRAPDSTINPYVPGSNPTVDNWARLIIAGQAKITEVPNPKGSTLRSDVIDAISSSGQLLLSDKDREKLSTLDTAFNVYETIKGLSEKINTFDVVGRVTGYLGRYLGGVTQYNIDIARYNATRQGFVSNVARTLGEKGTLAEGDVQRAINNLPTTNDIQAVAQGKLETLKTILQGAKDSIIQKSTEPLKDVTSGTLNSQPDNLRTKYNY